MRSKRWIVLILAFLCGTLTLWTFLPASEVQIFEQLNYPDYVANIPKCDLLDLLSKYKIAVTYPTFVNSNDSGKIEIGIESHEIGDEEKRNIHFCTLKVITSMVFTNASLSPGKYAISPFIGQDSLLHEFIVFPLRESEKIEGNVYVSVDLNESGKDNQTHLLIFTIPVKIQIRDMFGIPPFSIRIFSLIGFTLFGIIYLWISYGGR